MKRFFLMCLILVGVTAVTSCHSEVMEETDNSTGSAIGDKKGKVELSGLELNVESHNIPIISRISTPTSEEKNNYLIHIYDETGDTIQNYIFGDMPEVVELPVGTYTIGAFSSAKQESGFDKPFISGISDAFEVKENEIASPKSIKCYLSNIQVSATFSDEMSSLMGNDVAVLMWIDKDTITWTKDETRECFLAAPFEDGNILKVLFTGTVDGETIKEEKAFSDVNAGTHQIVNFDIKLVKEGNLMVGIAIDSETEVSDDITVVDPGKEPGIDDFPVNGEEEKPDSGDEEGEEPEVAAPVIIGTNFNGTAFEIDQPVEIPTTVSIDNPIPLVVTISVPAGLSNLFVNIESDKLTDLLPEVGLAANFDLAHPGLYAEALSSLGFKVGDEILGQIEVPFDITQFTGLLAPMGEGVHNFVLRVVDKNGKETSKTLTVKVVGE